VLAIFFYRKAPKYIDIIYNNQDFVYADSITEKRSADEYLNRSAARNQI
jgi:hypothetical protein